MKIRPFLFTLALTSLGAFAAPFEEATITRVVNQVDLLRANRKPQKASVGDEVKGTTAVRTGADSRTELRFPDDTITRLGANALFRFESGSRSMELDQGTILFSPAKGTGGGSVQMGAVTAAVAGTTFLGSHVPAEEIKVIVLEGKVKILWKGFLFGSRTLKPGEMFVLSLKTPRARASVTRLDLKKLIATSRLLEAGGFAQLPQWPAIEAAAKAPKRPFLGNILNPLGSGPFTAQSVRRTEDVNRPQPPPRVDRPPRPVSPPPPTPAPTPPPYTPPPYTPPFTGGA
jgi:hypothetical protein